jgi:hypothetical protein
VSTLSKFRQECLYPQRCETLVASDLMCVKQSRVCGGRETERERDGKSAVENIWTQKGKITADIN